MGNPKHIYKVGNIVVEVGKVPNGLRGIVTELDRIDGLFYVGVRWNSGITTHERPGMLTPITGKLPWQDQQHGWANRPWQEM